MVALDGATRPVPPSARRGRRCARRDGVVVDDDGACGRARRGGRRARRHVVLEGTKLAEAPAAGSETVGLVLWRVDGPIRVAQRRSGFLPNGDITEGALVVVPACRPGRARADAARQERRPDRRARERHSRCGRSPRPPGAVLTASIPTPPDVDGSERCLFELRTTDLVGTTRVEFVPDGVTASGRARHEQLLETDLDRIGKLAARRARSRSRTSSGSSSANVEM